MFQLIYLRYNNYNKQIEKNGGFMKKLLILMLLLSALVVGCNQNDNEKDSKNSDQEVLRVGSNHLVFDPQDLWRQLLCS